MLKKCFNFCLIVLAVTACDTFEPDGAERQEFESARAAWLRLGLEHYAFTYQRACECKPEWTRPARVVVRAGRVSAAAGVDESLAVASLTYYPTVDHLFKRISEAFADRSDRIDITYDRKLHYPTAVRIDPDRNVGDDEYIVDLSDFTPMQ
jgi:hypothetical protein